MLLGWSFGVLDALSYVRRHGTSHLAAVVLADETPKVPADPSDPIVRPESMTSRAASWRYCGVYLLLLAPIRGILSCQANLASQDVHPTGSTSPL